MGKNKKAIKKIKNLLKRWDGLCVICGEPFVSLESVTKEHIIPASLGGLDSSCNIAASHYNCNKLRGSRSLLLVAKVIEKKKEKMGKSFLSWVNKGVPNRFAN